MAQEHNKTRESIPRLGGIPEGRIQRYFCIDDEECRAFSMVSKEAEVLRRIPKRIRVGEEEVDGWIVELMVPATDGAVRIDPMGEISKI